jgi:SAM-dependent methyltransferase
LSFTVDAAAYDRFMGRYSRALAPQLAGLAGIAPGLCVLDVGAGSGALTAELIDRVGVAAAVAVDPSASLAAGLHKRFPDLDVRVAAAEALPFPDETFDAALAQLVVHFMTDPVAGLGEMARVTRRNGVIAASVWDHAGGGGPLAVFWNAARHLDPGVHDEAQLPGTRNGQLGELFRAARLSGIVETVMSVAVTHPTFEEWWEPFTLGVGPAGAYTAGLDPPAQAALRDLCRRMLPEPPFTVTGRAWAAVATVS